MMWLPMGGAILAVGAFAVVLWSDEIKASKATTVACIVATMVGVSLAVWVPLVPSLGH